MFTKNMILIFVLISEYWVSVFKLFCELGSLSIKWLSAHGWYCRTSSPDSKHMHFNSFLDRTTVNNFFTGKMYFFIIIVFSSYVLAFKLWNFISPCRLTLYCQEERSGFSAKLNSFYFIVCYETAADTRKMPSHHWAWGVQKRQEKNDCSSLSALALSSFLSVFIAVKSRRTIFCN